jgi:hypothetical protein
MARTPDKYRVQLDFTPEAFGELERLKADVEASSRADTIRYAMRVLRWVINTLRSGDRIAVRRRNGDIVEVEFPFLGQERPAGSQSEPAARTRRARGYSGDWVARGEEFVDTREQSAKDAGREAYRRATEEEGQ